MKADEKPKLQAEAAGSDWVGHTQTHQEAKQEAKTGETVPIVLQQKETKVFPSFTPVAEESKPATERSYGDIMEEKARNYLSQKEQAERANTMGYSVAFGLLDHLSPEEADKVAKEQEEMQKKADRGEALPKTERPLTSGEIREKSDRYFPMGYSPAFGLYTEEEEAGKEKLKLVEESDTPAHIAAPLSPKEYVKEIQQHKQPTQQTQLDKVAKDLSKDVKLALEKTGTIVEDAADVVASIPEAVVREVKEFGNAVVLTAEDVKDSLVGSTKEVQTDVQAKADEFRKAADKKLEDAIAMGKDIKATGEELKRDAKTKGEELKEAIRTQGNEWKETAKAKGEEIKATAKAKGEEIKETAMTKGNEAKSESWKKLADVEIKAREELSAQITKVEKAAHELIGGKPEEKKIEIVKEPLKPVAVKKALEEAQSKRQEEQGMLTRMMAWLFGPSKNPGVDSTLEEDEKAAQTIDRMNSVAYSPAGAMYQKEMLVVEHEHAPKTLGTIAAAEMGKEKQQEVVAANSSPVSHTSSYYQTYDSPTPKAEVKERVLEQTIDFFL